MIINRIIVFVIMVIALTLSAPGAMADYRNPSYDKALRQMQSRDYDSAVTSFGEASGLSAADPKLYFLRGQCFYHLDNYAKAIEDFEHSLKLKPKDSEALLWKGTAYSKMGEEKKATHSYLMAMRANPKLVTQFKKGGGVAGAEINVENERSVHAYQKAIHLYLAEGKRTELPARRSQPVTNDTKLSSILSQPTRRIEDIDEAIRMDPSNPGLYYERGRVYKRVGNLDRAIKDFSDAIKLNPMIAKYYLDRARCYHEQNKQTLCQSDIKRAQSVDPKVPRHITFVDDTK